MALAPKLEVRAGDLYQMKIVTEPVICSLALATAKVPTLCALSGPTAYLKISSLPNSDQKLLEEQKLKGSCPFLYTWNGEKYVFVKDMMWRSALGMPLGIMGGKKAFAFADISKEYLKIPGEMLQPKNGVYQHQHYRGVVGSSLF